MIEKLDIDLVQSVATNRCIINKINELVDAVNELQKDYENVCVCIGEQKLNYNPDTTKGLSTLVEEPEPADPFSKQRGWVGKLCKFWDEERIEEGLTIDTLKTVDTEDKQQPFESISWGWWKYCEPVKPDDDIIYKGE